MRCRGICYRFAAKKPLGGLRFESGQRPCSICGIFVDVSLNLFQRCPCCNNKLRINSRNGKSRKTRLDRWYKSFRTAVGGQKEEELLPTLK